MLTELFDVLSLKPCILSPPTPQPVPRTAHHGFEFRDVCFAYPGGNQTVVNGLNLHIRPSEKIAIIGDNGAGKSTIVKLLSRLYDPVSGKILLDGIDLRDYDLKSLRTSIGVLFQDYMRYDLSVRENIGFGSLSKMNDEQCLINASILAGASSLIKGLPYVWDQLLGRRYKTGVDLSGGEWQKIALSRSLMPDALLLILDEPTASLDAEAEDHFVRELQSSTHGPAIVIISHKLSFARLADRILVLQNGNIAEEGSHDELMRQNGRYAQLFNLQAAGFATTGYTPSKEENSTCATVS